MEDLYLLNGNRLENAALLRTLAFGEGVFESFRWKGSFPVFLSRHLERMRKGAEFLGIPPLKETQVRQRIAEAASLSGERDLHMKVCLLSGGSPVYYARPRTTSLLVSARPRSKIPGAVSLWVSAERRPEQSQLYAHKTLNYLGNIVAKRRAIERGADEALILDTGGAVAETSCQNIFWIKGNRIFTPTAEGPLLPGVTRHLTLQVCRKLGFEINSGRFPLEQLLQSDCAFLTNAVMGMVYVQAVDGTTMPFAPDPYENIRGRLYKELGW